MTAADGRAGPRHRISGEWIRDDGLVHDASLPGRGPYTPPSDVFDVSCA